MFPRFLTQNLPKKLALCLAIPSSVIIVYFLWKQNKDIDEEDDNFQVQSRQTIIEVKVPCDCIGAIIGQEGSTIKELQKQTNTRIHFKDKGSNLNGEDRLLLIRGTNIDAQKAEMEIKRIIAEIPIPLTDEIEVPGESIGRIIGRQGNTIKTIMKASGCKINIDKVSNIDTISNNTKIQLIGGTEQILIAKNMISDKVKEDYKRRNGSNGQLRKSQSYVADFSNELFSNEVPRTVEFLNPNETYEVYVTAVATPNLFWVNIRNEWKKFSNIEKEMKKFYDKHEQNTSLFLNELKRGQIVVARFKHCGWTRAEIADIRSHDSNNNNDDCDIDIDLYSIDYGENQWLKKKDIRKLLNRFNKSQAQAIPCSLHGIALMDYSEWKDDKIRLFEDLTSPYNDWKVMLATFVQYNYTDDGSYAVIKLFDPYDNSDVSERLLQEEISNQNEHTSEDEETFYSEKRHEEDLITHSF